MEKERNEYEWEDAKAEGILQHPTSRYNVDKLLKTSVSLLNQKRYSGAPEKSRVFGFV